MNKFIYILSILLLVLSSCEDYLDEKPSKTNDQEIESVDDLNLLLDLTLDFGGSHVTNDVQFSNLADDCSITPGAYGAIGTWIDFSFIENYIWNEEITANTDDSWTNTYKHIWVANYILTMVDDLEGSEEEKAELKAEAHLIKAYKLMSLMMKHCLYPSSENTDEMGLPLKETTEFGELPARATLAETVAAITFHIEEGQKISVERTTSWRDSEASAASIAARFYTYMHDFVKAEMYAQQAIDLHSYIVNMENEVSIIPGDYPRPSTYFLSPYSSPFYSGWESQIKQYTCSEYWFFPSPKLVEAYDTTDLRTYFYSKQYLEGYFGVSDYLYEKVNGAVLTGPDVTEMYFILAECAARKSDFAKCMEYVEQVRINRFAAADYVPLAQAINEVEAIELIANERLLELPFTCSRWSDVKRLNAEGLVTPIILSRDFYVIKDGSIDFSQPMTYTLDPNSRKYARPLPREVVDFTDGKVKQNTY